MVNWYKTNGGKKFPPGGDVVAYPAHASNPKKYVI
jgi:hypothetical protein